MRIFRHFEELPPDLAGCVVAIGNFDGVHRGHQAVIHEAGLIARDAGVRWAVLSFEPHPRQIFQPDIEPFRLTPFRIKAHHIEELGVDDLIVLHFDKEFAGRAAESFIGDILVDSLKAGHVVSGYDFVFGKGRQGDCEMLLHKGQELGFGFTAVQAVKDSGAAVYSSTRVRQCLQEGDPRGAAGILGRAFEIEGRIVEGDKRGREIGFPTANLLLDGYLCPKLGVYAVRAGVDQGADTVWHDGVANLGMRPTFDGEDVRLEVHLFDRNEDLYGKHLRAALIDFIRPERKFDGLDDLKAQIAEDADEARRILRADSGASSV